MIDSNGIWESCMYFIAVYILQDINTCSQLSCMLYTFNGAHKLNTYVRGTDLIQIYANKLECVGFDTIYTF